MYLSEILLDQLNWLSAGTDRPLTIVETGSIRSAEEQYRLDDGWSTLTFAEWAKARGDHVVSIDLDPRAAAGVLGRYGLRDHVDLRRGHSLVVLRELAAMKVSIDLLFLDSENDPYLILDEFLIAQPLVRSPGAVIIDDVDPGHGAHKGDAVMAWLDGRTPYRVVRRTGTGYSTGVLIIDN